MPRRTRCALGVEGSGFSAPLLGLIGGGLLIIFSLWWIYFAKPAYRFLTSNRIGFLWGYGHYFIFGAAAAIGAGLAVNVDHLLGKTDVSASARRRGGVGAGRACSC